MEHVRLLAHTLHTLHTQRNGGKVANVTFVASVSEAAAQAVVYRGVITACEMHCDVIANCILASSHTSSGTCAKAEG